jgi:hypothetical protein
MEIERCRSPAELRCSLPGGFLSDRAWRGAYTPRSSQTVAGLPVAQVYPQSVGMGVGFSVIVNANFNAARAALEKRLGRPIRKCEPPSDNMRTCDLEIAEKKTVTLMAEDNPKATMTLIGCYYFYEK